MSLGLDERRYEDCILAAAQSLLRARFGPIDKFYISQASFPTLFRRSVFHLSRQLSNFDSTLRYIKFLHSVAVLIHPIWLFGSEFVELFFWHRTTIILQFLIRESSSSWFNTSWPGNAHSRLAYRDELHKIKTVKISEKEPKRTYFSDIPITSAH